MTQHDLPPHMSYSQVSSYLRCGESYRLERLLKAPQAPAWALAGGSAVHTGTEQWDRMYLEGTVSEDFGQLWDQHFQEQIRQTEEKDGIARTEWRASGRRSKEWPDKETEAWWNHHGPTFLANWASWRLNSPWEIWIAPDGTPAIEIEASITVGGRSTLLPDGGLAADSNNPPTDDVTIRGGIDRIMVTPDGLVLPLDIKSGGEPDSKLQLGTYAKMMRDRLGVNPAWGIYWMARTGSTTAPFPMAKYTDEYLDLVYGDARRGMEAGIFIPKESRDCSWCSVRNSCFAFDGSDSDEFTPLSLTVK